MTTTQRNQRRKSLGRVKRHGGEACWQCGPVLLDCCGVGRRWRNLFSKLRSYQ